MSDVLRETVSQPRLDLEDILDQARTVTREVVATHAQAVDLYAAWPVHGIRALQAAGLGGLVVSREQGGLGHGLLATVRVCEMLGSVCPSTALCFGMHLVGSAVIGARATAEQQQSFLNAINDGRHLTTLALSEPGTGAHFYVPNTQMTDMGDAGFAICGTKSFVTNGGHADSYVISVVAAEPDAPPGQFSCVVVPGSAPGLSWRGEWNGFGMRGNSSITADLNDVVIPRTYLLGEAGDQIWYVFEIVAPYFLMAMAGTYLGIAETALEEARTHLQRRSYDHTGELLASQPILQHRFGQLWASVDRTRRLVYHWAAQADAGVEGALAGILSAKAEVAECVVSVVNEAMTLTGGLAYRENSRLSRCLRDARAAHVMAPTTDLLRLWAGRALLGIPLLAD